MDYKPSDVFVGVIDFFAVLLPGAIIVAIASSHMPPFIIGPDGIVPELAGTARWAGFIVASYAAGHLLFFMGSGLDSTLYDPLRRWLIQPDRDRAFAKASEIKQASIPAIHDDVVNTFQWSRATLRLSAPEALMEVERFEADSKFFRGLAVALYVLVLLFVLAAAPPASCIDGGEAGCLSLAPLPFALAIPLLLLVGKISRDRFARLHKKSPVKPSRDAEERRFRLRLVLLSAFVAVLLAVTTNWKALVLFALVHLCILRYAERRWKSTKTAYQYVAVLHQIDINKASRAAAAQIGEIVEQAGAIAVRSRGGRREVLLVRARNDATQWLFPKGHIEPNETPETAAVRELREEAGVWGHPVALAGVIEFNLSGKRHRTRYYVIEARMAGEPVEQRDHGWFALDEVASALTFPDARELFLTALPLMTPLYRVLASSRDFEGRA